MKARDTAPDDELANRALAAIYLATNRPEAAEPSCRAPPIAGAKAPVLAGPRRLLRLDGTVRRSEGRAGRIARAESADGAAAQVRLAALEYASGSREEGRRLLARVIKRHPTSEALALEARFNEAEGR